VIHDSTYIVVMVYFNRQRGDSRERCMYACVSTFIHGWMDVCMSGGQKSQAVLCCDVLMAMSEHFA
jgi:hypothetical protein